MRRKGAEFNDKTKDIIFSRAKGKDEITGEPLGEYPEVDHIIPLAWALLNAPDIPTSFLKSPKNGRVINRDTHKERHRNFNDDEAWFLVTWFRSIQKRLLE